MGFTPEAVVDYWLSLPQPGTEWTRLREETCRTRLGAKGDTALQGKALNPGIPARQRVRAIQLLAPGFAELTNEFLAALAKDADWQVRSQSAWLLGLKVAEGEAGNVDLLLRLLDDPDPFVRRRAAEAFNRCHTLATNEALVRRLADPVRLVRYIAMTALAHRPSADWVPLALGTGNSQTQLRACVTAAMRHEPVGPEQLLRLIRSVSARADLSAEDHLDMLRVCGLYQKTLDAHPESRGAVTNFLVQQFPHPDRTVRWEQARLLGEYRVGAAFGGILAAMETEPDRVTQFHLAQAISIDGCVFEASGHHRV